MSAPILATADHRGATIRILVSCFPAMADDGSTTILASCASTAVVNAIAAEGGIPILAPMNQSDNSAEAMMDQADALVLTGGHDVSAHGQPHRPERSDATRDQSDLRLLAAARRRGLPVLGICRGMQLMAVSSAGHLSPVPNDLAAEHNGPGGHLVTVRGGSRLSSVETESKIMVPTLHHFAVRRVGEHEVVAIADDGVVEAIEHPERWELGVQWHPELSDGPLSAAVWISLMAAGRAQRQHSIEQRPAS